MAAVLEIASCWISVSYPSPKHSAHPISPIACWTKQHLLSWSTLPSWFSAFWPLVSSQTQPQCTLSSGLFSSLSFILDQSKTLHNHTSIIVYWNFIHPHSLFSEEILILLSTVAILFVFEILLRAVLCASLVCLSAFVLWLWIFLSYLSNELSKGWEYLVYPCILCCASLAQCSVQNVLNGYLFSGINKIETRCQLRYEADWDRTTM